MPDAVDRLCMCRICVPRGDEETWDDGDRKLVADVQGYGWHLLKITGSREQPPWCFTVGLWHTFGSPEVAMFGLRPDDMAIWLNRLGEQVRGGDPVRPDERRPGVLPGFDLVCRPVDPSWYPELFGYALWFTGPPLPVVELVWPDREGLYPWDDRVGERCLRDQPRCWESIERQPAGPWRPMAIHATLGWPPPDMWGFTTKRIVAGTTAVLLASHEADGSWQFVDGGSVTIEDVTRCHVAHLVDKDPTLAEVSDLELGWLATREAPGEPWRRSPIEE